MKRIQIALSGAALACLLGCLALDTDSGSESGAVAEFDLTVSAPNGSVDLDPSGGTYDSGTVVTLTPSADNGYTFSRWTGDLTGTNNPATIKMNRDKSVTAVFVADAVPLNGTLSNDDEWNSTTGEYHIDGSLTINADITWGRKIKVRIDDDAVVRVNGSGKLTIEEGVEIMLGTGAYFEIGYSTAGTLVAKGSDSLLITFTKSTGVENWGYDGGNSGGIVFYDKTTAQSVLDFCVIEYATSGVSVQNIPVKITNSMIRNNLDLGVDFVGTAAPKDSASFTNNEISHNGGYGISISPEGITSLSGNLNLDDNGTIGILVTGSTAVAKSGTWKNHQAPYIFDVYVNIGSSAGTKITIAPGVVCKFSTEAYIWAGYSYSATLVAIGTDSLPITFTRNDGVENWGYAGGNAGGIVLWDKTTNQTVFDHCIVEYATSGFNITSLAAVITNSKIRNNANYGIDFTNKAMPKDSASFAGDSITDNGGYPISIAAEGLSRLSGDTYIKRNTPNAIEVTGGSVTQSGTWKKHGVPYLFTAYANIGATAGVTVTINPGAAFQFAADAYLNVGYSNPATLIAEGDVNDSILFTKTPDGAEWGDSYGGIVLWSKTTANTSLKFCVIEKALQGVYVDGTKITMSRCSVRDNTGVGMVFTASASPKDSASFIGNKFINNGDYGIKIHASAVGSLSGTGMISGNAEEGIFVTGNKLPANAVWKNHDGTPYVIDGEIVVESATGVTLTIRPATRLEFVQDASIRVGYAGTGAFIADGTDADLDPADALITFTAHIAGASWGSSGYAGINLWNGTAATTLLRNCSITNATGGVYINTHSKVTIEDTAIESNDTYGIGYTGNQVPLDNITVVSSGGTNPSGDLVDLNL